MILGLLALATGQATEPAVTRYDISIVGPSYPSELGESVNRYNACLSSGRRQYAPDMTVEAQHRADVERCDAQLPEIIASALRIWSRGKDPQAASAEVDEIFRRQRESHLQRGVQLDQLMRRNAASETSPKQSAE